MDPLTAALIGTGINVATPYAMQGINYGLDAAFGNANMGSIDMPETYKLQMSLEEEQDRINEEAIRRAQETGGRHFGAAAAMSGAAGLSSFNPIMAAMARQGEMQAGSLVSDLQRRSLTDRVDTMANKNEMINQQLANIEGGPFSKRRAMGAYASGAQKSGNLMDAERYRAAAASV